MYSLGHTPSTCCRPKLSGTPALLSVSYCRPESEAMCSRPRQSAAYSSSHHLHQLQAALELDRKMQCTSLISNLMCAAVQVTAIVCTYAEVKAPEKPKGAAAGLSESRFFARLQKPKLARHLLEVQDPVKPKAAAAGLSEARFFARINKPKLARHLLADVKDPVKPKAAAAGLNEARFFARLQKP